MLKTRTDIVFTGWMVLNQHLVTQNGLALGCSNSGSSRLCTSLPHCGPQILVDTFTLGK